MTILITNQGHNSNATGATVALPIVSNIVAGSSIVVAVNEGNTSGVAGTLADDAGNAYSILSQGSPNNAIANGRDTLWVCHNCQALNAGQNITYTRNTTAVNTVIAGGSISGGPFATDKIATPTTGLSTSPSNSSGTLSSSNEAVFAFLALSGSFAVDSVSQVSGFSAPFDNIMVTGGGPRVAGGSEVVSSTASVLYNPTISSRPWCLQLATFKIALPTVTSITPTNGTTLGGTPVTITGTNFTGATAVTFGGTAATNIVVVNSTTITANTPAHASGVVDVVVTTPNGVGTGTSLYTYVIPLPTVSSITPTNGTTLGNTPVTITGTNLTGASSVTFGGTAATNIVVVNSTTITANTPAHASGVVDVAVTTSGGTGTGTGLYTYVTPLPTVSSIAPNSGPTIGNTSVTITGTNLTGATSVTFGGTAATSVVVVNSTTITAVTPAHTSGVVDVAVTTPGGTGTGTGLYTYIGAYQKQSSIVTSEIMSGASFVTKTVTGKLSIHEGQQVKAAKSINKVIII